MAKQAKQQNEVRTPGEPVESKKKPTQEQFAKLIGVSQPDISRLFRKGVLTRGASLSQQVHEYCKHIREQAAGRLSGDGEHDLVKERARLAARQSEKLEIETAKLRGELIPRESIAEILNFHNSTIRTRLLAIATRLKSQRPELETAAITALKNLVDETLIELSHVRFPRNIDERTRRYFSDLHAAAKPNGDRVGG